MMAEGPSWLYISLLSSAFFKGCNILVLRHFPAPVKLRVERRKVWLWANLATSLVHSIISATLSVYSIYSTPSMIEDMINTRNSLLRCTLAISIGYFVYDVLDLAMNDRQRSLCIIIHHMLVLSSFLVCVVGDKLLPFAIFALLVEVNSVFLHTRRLMRMSEFNVNEAAYKINGFLNLITFLIFRFISCGWVTIRLVRDRHNIHQFSFAVGFFGLSVAILQNFFLLQQVCSSDAKMIKKHSSKSQNGVAPVDKDHNQNKSNGPENLKQILRMANGCRPTD